MDELQERAEKLLAQVDLKSEELEKQFEVTEDIEELLDDLEKRDRHHKLVLDDPDLYLKLAIVCQSNEKLDEAEDLVKKSLRLENSYLGFLVSGRILQKKKNYKGALGEYDSALEYDDSGLVHRYRYEALKSRDMQDRALDALEKALEKNENGFLLAKKADLLMDMGEPERAKEVYENAEEIDPDLDNKDKKIDDLLKEASKKVIPEEYDKILILKEDAVEAWLGKAECYQKLNQPEKAKETLERSLEHVEDERVVDKLKDLNEKENEPAECPHCGGSGKCHACDGEGNCDRCGGSGDCLKCDGASECPDCYGSGECSNCDGEGKGLIFRCKVCSGTGHCQTCDGYGRCQECEGTGNCELCGGNGNCDECQGSGVCELCGGKGLIGRVKGG